MTDNDEYQKIILANSPFGFSIADKYIDEYNNKNGTNYRKDDIKNRTNSTFIEYVENGINVFDIIDHSYDPYVIIGKIPLEYFQNNCYDIVMNSIYTFNPPDIIVLKHDKLNIIKLEEKNQELEKNSKKILKILSMIHKILYEYKNSEDYDEGEGKGKNADYGECESEGGGNEEDALIKINLLQMLIPKMNNINEINEINIASIAINADYLPSIGEEYFKSAANFEKK